MPASRFRPWCSVCSTFRDALWFEPKNTQSFLDLRSFPCSRGTEYCHASRQQSWPSACSDPSVLRYTERLPGGKDQPLHPGLLGPLSMLCPRWNPPYPTLPWTVCLSTWLSRPWCHFVYPWSLTSHSVRRLVQSCARHWSRAQGLGLRLPSLSLHDVYWWIAWWWFALV